MHCTIARCASLRTDAEKFGPFFDQSDAAGGARPAEQREALPHRPATARDHQSPFWIRVDGDGLDFVPISLQLVSYYAGQGCSHMLAHLGANNVDGHRTARIDPVPDRRLEQIART